MKGLENEEFLFDLEFFKDVKDFEDGELECGDKDDCGRGISL